MSGQERRNAILKHLDEHGTERIATLARHLDVSEVTIRNDVRSLEEVGFLVRLHGSVSLSQNAVAELRFAEHRRKNPGIKAIIGAAAAKMVGEREAIVLDAGTTTLEIARNLKDRDGLHVLTNGLDIAVELSKSPGIEVTMLGGRVRKSALSCSGPEAREALSQCRFDKVFLGVEAMDSEVGIVSGNEPEGRLNRAMLSCARQIVAVTDGSKARCRGIYRVAGFGEIHQLVTDETMPGEIVRKFEAAGAKVTVCGNEKNTRKRDVA